MVKFIGTIHASFYSGILDLAEDGGIKVNSNMQTSQKGERTVSVNYFSEFFFYAFGCAKV